MKSSFSVLYFMRVTPFINEYTLGYETELW
jgi:hypothetical protein